jgi:hypothetical protein
MPDTRSRVFDRILVDHLVRGSTRVSWGGVYYQFADPQPWSFTLQVGSTGNPLADDWAACAAPTTNFFAIDPQQRDLGTVRTLHYRVQLTTPNGVYYSNPAAVFGLLNLHDWLIAREVVRKELLRHHLATVPGWLLKRRRSGPTLPAAAAADPRTAVVDPLTGDIMRREGRAALVTEGTEYVGGYYDALPFSLDTDNLAEFDTVDPQEHGNVNDDALQVSARALLLPQIVYRDVFVAAHSDLRYELGRVKVTVHQRGVPLVGTVACRRLSFSDVIYTVPVPTD